MAANSFANVEVDGAAGFLRQESSKVLCVANAQFFEVCRSRYVSTGFGPVSSAVGIFEPVTMTRSTSAAPGAAACWANAFAVKIKKNPTIAVREDPELSGAFISDAKRLEESH